MLKENDYKFHSQLEKELFDKANGCLIIVQQINAKAHIQKYLDEQWYLDYLDELNGYSIDCDREDTQKNSADVTNPHC